MLNVRTYCAKIFLRSSTHSLFIASSYCLQNFCDAHVPVLTDAQNVNTNKLTNQPTENYFPRERRYALLLCYHGENYFGLQYNNHGATIEGELFPAFIRAGIVKEDDYNDARFKIGYTRASRTDSGVSALRQTVALNLSKEINIDELNSYLPPDIRVLGQKRVIKLFDAQKWCDFRSYCYIMPSFALCFWKNESDTRVNYRIDADTLRKANEVFKQFEGTHKFHNYTEKRDMWDSRSTRSIITASVSDAFLHGNMEMVAFHIKGRSFMLHQIRRMIGMTVAIMRGKAPYSFLHQSFEDPILPAPTAPSLGLMLEMQYFDNYNKIHGTMERLVWDEYDYEVEKFKKEVIVPRIVQIELEEKIMESYLDDIKRHSFTVHPDSSKLTTIGNWKGLDLDEEDMKLIAKYQ